MSVTRERGSASVISMLAEEVLGNRPRVGDERGDVVLRHLLLDFLGNALAGSATKWCRQVTEVVVGSEGEGVATVLGTQVLAAPHLAAYANAFAGNILDADDTYVYVGHPGTTVVAAALAVGESERSSLKSVVQAVDIGYRVSTFFLKATHMLRFTKSEHSHGMGTAQTFGAAATAARLLGLNFEETRSALALAAVNAPVPCQAKFADFASGVIPSIKNNFGWACSGGVLAGLLAENGVGGNVDMFDPPYSFWAMIGCDEPGLDYLMRSLASEPVEASIGFKPYPCCRVAHSAIDCARAIWSRTRLSPTKVSSVEVDVASLFGFRNLSFTPRSLLDAQFSIPYLVSLALHGRFQQYEFLRTEDLDSESIRSLASRICLGQRARSDTEPQRESIDRPSPLGARVTVRMVDGTTLSECVDWPRGDPLNPLSAEELTEKFLVSAAPIVGSQRAEAIRKIVLEERKANVRVGEITEQTRR